MRITKEHGMIVRERKRRQEKREKEQHKDKRARSSLNGGICWLCQTTTPSRRMERFLLCLRKPSRLAARGEEMFAFRRGLLCPLVTNGGFVGSWFLATRRGRSRYCTGPIQSQPILRCVPCLPGRTPQAKQSTKPWILKIVSTSTTLSIRFLQTQI